MSVELYKKYRPKTWKNFIGQTPVVRSLREMVKTGSVPSAILFSGPRGCGKTSAAFVLAKALNCENLTDDYGPCSKCSSCAAIDNGSFPGVHYFSMANASGVESVREMVQEAQLNQGAKQTVYIVDEVHNCSKAAFDSLLIPLEQNLPALFIMCTTEPDKVPDTVLSRVQQRRFSLVKPVLMQDYVSKLVAHAGMDVSESVVRQAVRAGRGSVRDTLTQLETIISTGSADASWGERFYSALAEKSLAKMLLVVSEAVESGVSPRGLLAELFEDMKQLFLFESGVTDVSIPVPVESVSRFGGLRVLDVLFKELSQCVVDVSRGVSSQLALEATCVRMVAVMNKMGV